MYCFFSSRRRHTRYWRDWSSDVCSSDLGESEAWLTASRYARMYRLARRLRARASTPYEYIRSVQDHLRTGLSYNETPPRAAVPLDAFLFRDKRGYCQQFSGAMALLLRMGG